MAPVSLVIIRQAGGSVPLQGFVSTVNSWYHNCETSQTTIVENDSSLFKSIKRNLQIFHDNNLPPWNIKGCTRPTLVVFLVQTTCSTDRTNVVLSFMMFIKNTIWHYRKFVWLYGIRSVDRLLLMKASVGMTSSTVYIVCTYEQ